MGTRSLTKVHDGMTDTDIILVNMYRQFDGYPEGHGVDLVEFLDERVIGNGIGGNSPEKYSNGSGCFAAQLISHFKDENEPGGFYLYPIDCGDCWEEFVYDVYVESNEPVRVKITCVYGEGEIIFDGNVKDLKTFCTNPPRTEDGDYIPFVPKFIESQEK